MLCMTVACSQFSILPMSCRLIEVAQRIANLMACLKCLTSLNLRLLYDVALVFGLQVHLKEFIVSAVNYSVDFGANLQ